MTHLRKYGTSPFTTAVIHGGPGTPGEMASVARELSSITGVLEPLQTEATIEGQVKELRSILKEHGALPITLIGFSWGAMLSYIFTALHPRFVKKLILIGSGPYEERYAINITSTRMSRLGEKKTGKTSFLWTGFLAVLQLKIKMRLFAAWENCSQKLIPMTLCPTK